MRHRGQLQALARGLQLAGRAIGDKGFNTAARQRQLNARLLVDALSHILGHRAAPALRLRALFPRCVETAVGLRNAVGALLIQLHIERGAILADGRILRLHRRAIRRRDGDLLDLHRAMVREEQIVRHRAIDRHPRIIARDDRGRRQEPGAMRVSGANGERNNSGSDEKAFGQGLHRVSPRMRVSGCEDYLVSLSVMAPSSSLPEADAVASVPGAHLNGISTSSLPPTSRLASTMIL